MLQKKSGIWGTWIDVFNLSGLAKAEHTTHIFPISPRHENKGKWSKTALKCCVHIAGKPCWQTLPTLGEGLCLAEFQAQTSGWEETGLILEELRCSSSNCMSSLHFYFFLSSVFENQGWCYSAWIPQEQSLGSCYYLNSNILSCFLILLGHRSTLRLVPCFPHIL